MHYYMRKDFSSKILLRMMFGSAKKLHYTGNINPCRRLAEEITRLLYYHYIHSYL